MSTLFSVNKPRPTVPFAGLSAATGNVQSETVVTSAHTLDGTALTVHQFKGVLRFASATSDWSMATPTATALVAHVTDAAIGDNWAFMICNDSVSTLTLTMGTGVTVLGGGAITVPPDTNTMLFVRLSAISSPAATLMPIGGAVAAGQLPFVYDTDDIEVTFTHGATTASAATPVHLQRVGTLVTASFGETSFVSSSEDDTADAPITIPAGFAFSDIATQDAVAFTHVSNTASNPARVVLTTGNIVRVSEADATNITLTTHALVIAPFVLQWETAAA